MHPQTLKEFNSALVTCQRKLLEMHFNSGVGHIGGNLSCLDSILFLYTVCMDCNRDAFILSKGHAAGALYVSLWAKGLLHDNDLVTFHQEDTLLAGHPKSGWHSQIEFSTGSLGHGFSLAAGKALARKIKNKSGHIYCLCSDGEFQEGSSWEALVFAHHHKLDNLTILIDNNGLQGFGSTQQVASIASLASRIEAFEVEVQQIKGHDPIALYNALNTRTNGVKVIVMETTKGHGVHFMENEMKWHYLPLNTEQYQLACEAINKNVIPDA